MEGAIYSGIWSSIVYMHNKKKIVGVVKSKYHYKWWRVQVRHMEYLPQ